MNELGLKIKELREKNNLTQQDLAKRLNISFQSISKWERGESEPNVSHIVNLSTLFGVTTDILLGVDQIEKRKDEISKLLNTLQLESKERLNVAKQAFTEFPENMEFCIALADSTFWYNLVNEYENKTEASEEAIRLWRIAEERTDNVQMRAYAIDQIVACLVELDRFDEAKEYAEKFPDPIFPEKDDVIAMCLKGEEETTFNQVRIAEHLENALVEMIYSEDQHLVESAISLIERIVPSKDLGSYSRFYILAHMFLAIELVKAERYMEAKETVFFIHSFAIEQSEKYGTESRVVPHPIPFLDRLTVECDKNTYSYESMFLRWISTPELGHILCKKDAQFKEFRDKLLGITHTASAP